MIASSRIVSDLRAGRPVLLDDAAINDALDLRALAVVSVPIVCRRCVFRGGILASHVHFLRGLDLGGSTISEVADFEGARFDESVLFGSADPPTTVSGARFAFASFDDLADFAGVMFKTDADFSSARFRALSRFSGSTFDHVATFSAARFDHEALLAGATFRGPARFKGALFGGVVDFRGCSLYGETTFRDADFQGRANFSRATVFGKTEFDDARFGSDAVFVGAAFNSTVDPAVSFDHVAVDGRLDLSAAILPGRVQLQYVSASALSFTDTTFASTSLLYMNNVSSEKLALSLHDIDRISQHADRVTALERIEATAKSADDLSLANDARYRLQELASDDDWTPRRYADFVVYRWGAGYLVRPLRPLLWLSGLAVLAALARTLRSEKKQRDWRILRAGRRFVSALTYTVSPKAVFGQDSVGPLRRIELAIYALLLLAFLLGLANSNPTLRQMVDALL